MIREWEKFHADFKKLKSTADRYTERVAEGFIKQMTHSRAACEKAETGLTSATDAARSEGGIAGKGLSDFLKYKPFSEAKRTFDAAVNDLKEDIQDLSDFCREAQKVSNQIVDLHKALEKDLKARKTVTDGRKETEALLDKVEDEYQRLMKVVAFKNRPPRAVLIYPDGAAKVIAGIVANAPKLSKPENDLPEILQLKELKGNVTRAMTGVNKVIRACGLAVDAIPEGKPAALAEMNVAKYELDRLKAMDAQYRAATSRHHKDIQASPDRTKIEKLVDSVAKSLLEAERAFAGAMADIRKAS